MGHGVREADALVLSLLPSPAELYPLHSSLAVLFSVPKLAVHPAKLLSSGPQDRLVHPYTKPTISGYRLHCICKN